MTIVSRSRIVQRIGSDVEFLYGVDDKQRTVAVPYGTQPVTVTQYPYNAKGDGITDDTAAIQAAIDAAYAAGGGEVHFPVGKFVVSATITVPQRVTLVGSGAGFVNQYVDTYVEPKGSVLFLASGSNTTVVEITCRLTADSGNLVESGSGDRNNDARHFGGMRGMTVWGNRSASQAYTETDLNSSGDGVYVVGARYVTIENCVIAFCAGVGLKTRSYNYGTGSITSSNFRSVGNTAISNAGDGMDLLDADSFHSGFNCGYNGGNGITGFVINGTVSNGLLWNNGEHGWYSQGYPTSGVTILSGVNSYDNDSCGFCIDGGGASTTVPALTGCVARGNGVDTGLAAGLRSNFRVTSTASDWSLSGCVASGVPTGSNTASAHGFYLLNGTYTGVFSGNKAHDNTVSDYYFQSSVNLLEHVQDGSTSFSHPGFTATGNINMGGYSLMAASSVRFDTWDTKSSDPAGTLAVGGSSIIACNFTGAKTITDISFTGTGLPLLLVRNVSSDAVTFTHNTAKIRCANATDVVLGQHESAMFVMVSTGVWQQIGAAA